MNQKHQTVFIDSKQAHSLLEEIDLYRTGLDRLKKRLLLTLPDAFFSEKSDYWWEKQVVAGERDIQNKHYRIFKTPDALMKHLHNLSK